MTKRGARLPKAITPLDADEQRLLVIMVQFNQRCINYLKARALYKQAREHLADISDTY